MQIELADNPPYEPRVIRTVDVGREITALERQQAVLAYLDAAPRARGRGRKLPDEHYETVADVYRGAIAAGQPPTEAVARHFRATRASAGRWVAVARKKGYLGAALGTKAGEQPSEGGA